LNPPEGGNREETEMKTKMMKAVLLASVMAFGATAVLVGRAYVWGLAANGALGVAHVIRLLRDELEMVMALTGCARLDEVSRECLADRRD
jgi:isopentenyl diphosphate isomerase/L-lactate dehydrogenase-like FMN-dependent dehydrogenase